MLNRRHPVRGGESHHRAEVWTVAFPFLILCLVGGGPHVEDQDKRWGQNLSVVGSPPWLVACGRQSSAESHHGLCNAFASNVCIWVQCTSFAALRCARQCATHLVRLSVSLHGSVPCQYFWSARSNSFVRGCYLHYLCGCSTCCFNPVLVHVQASKPALVPSRSTSPQWFAVPTWSHLVLLPLSATRRSSSVGCSSNHLTSG